MKWAAILGCLLTMAGCVLAPPAAQPIPAAAVAVPIRFTVYFALNSARIDPAGLAILGHAANAYRLGGRPLVQITGYTDTVGEQGYNQQLSNRRALQVAWTLARLGVPQNVMTVIGRDENDLAVSTPAGAADRRNRRVTIIE